MATMVTETSHVRVDVLVVEKHLVESKVRIARRAVKRRPVHVLPHFPHAPVRVALRAVRLLRRIIIPVTPDAVQMSDGRETGAREEYAERDDGVGVAFV